MTSFLWPWKAKNRDFCCPRCLVHILSRVKCQKKEEELPQLCMWSMVVRASSPPLVAIHTQLWQLLSQFLLQILLFNMWDTNFGSIFIFLMYLMRVIKKFGTRESILIGVELSWIFLFNHCYYKITDLVCRKGCFETKKNK